MKIIEIVKATGGRLISTGSNKSISGISIDSRTIKPGEVFIAIKGKNYDGGDFIKEALGKGASGVVSKYTVPHVSKKTSLVVVSDTVKALGDIALHHRRKFNIPVIGITGTNGKTTAKGILAHILSSTFNVLKNKGTENNFIGVPLTLLRLRPNHQVAVLEMGASQVGEIDRLSQILKPTIGIITNIGPSHLEYFGDLDTVLRTKSEILNYVSEDSVVLNGDDRLLSQIHKRINPITFGIDKPANFRATNIVEKNKALEFNLNGIARFRLSLMGRHNIYNGLAGIAIASMLGMDFKTIQKRLTTFKPLAMRMRISSVSGISIIDDTYNSNPLSSRCAIQFLSNFKARGKKILVTADMLELGRRAKYFHREIGRFVARSRIDKLITIGELSKETLSSARKSGMKRESIWNCDSKDKAVSILAKIARPGDTVLVKGSRAMKMEKVIEKFKKCCTTYYIH